jgi:hypothetical protein
MKNLWQWEQPIKMMMKLLKVGSHIHVNVIRKEAPEKQKHKANFLNS